MDQLKEHKLNLQEKSRIYQIKSSSQILIYIFLRILNHAFIVRTLKLLSFLLELNHLMSEYKTIMINDDKVSANFEFLLKIVYEFL
eukprot:UN25199